VRTYTHGVSRFGDCAECFRALGHGSAY
jgi:hypothetical protein